MDAARAAASAVLLYAVDEMHPVGGDSWERVFAVHQKASKLLHRAYRTAGAQQEKWAELIDDT